jgi:competence protein ComEA
MPELSVPRTHALVGAAALLVFLVIAGRFLLDAGAASSSEAAGVTLGAEPIRAAPAPPVVVHVVGAVPQPGLYRLARGKRVADALARAGGATARADLALINLAALVSDGQQIVVPARASPGSTAPVPGEAAAGPVHLNSATIEQLDALPGVGPVTAQKIVDYREKHGAFSSVRELDAIPGIGPARLEQLTELVAP